LHVRPGTELEVVHGDGRLVRARYHGLFLEAEGELPADRLDVVYTPEPSDDDWSADAELGTSVAIATRDDGGGVFGNIGKDPEIANRLLVRRLGATRGKRVLVRYDEHGAYAIGWVPTSALRAIPRLEGGGSGGLGMIGGRRPDRTVVHLARGTLLADPSGPVVGVVTSDEDVPCEADCAGAPLVKVAGCGGELSLRARPDPLTSQADRNEK
jgi:hypothetical protein